MPTPPPPNTPSAILARLVAQYRAARGWTAEQLAAAVSDAGLKWDRFVVRNIEQGRRKSVTLDELLVLAYVLDVHPVDLMVPPDSALFEPFPIAPNVTAPAGRVRDWIAGLDFLDDSNSLMTLARMMQAMPEQRAKQLAAAWQRRHGDDMQRAAVTAEEAERAQETEPEQTQPERR